jgi:putative tryptophan/tyrosine transport system substrate-binding protein
MRRREFIALLCGATTTWSLPAHAQQSIIGFLSARSPTDSERLVAAFREGLKDGGYSEGQNVAIEYRWAEGDFERLPSLANELVRRPVALLVTAGGNGAAISAKAATSKIPIIFVIGTDPVEDGLVASLSRPGGNMTGVTLVTSELVAKRLGLLRELMPGVGLIAVLLNRSSPASQSQSKDIEAAAQSIGQHTLQISAANDEDLERAFAAFSQRRADALVVMPDPFFNTRRDKIIALAARHAVPAIYDSGDSAVAGGLMSYGTSYAPVYREAGRYAARVLKGELPNDLPVLQPTKFDLVINQKTAKALGITVPQALLATADEVIE